jgi:hypothetical protein
MSLNGSATSRLASSHRPATKFVRKERSAAGTIAMRSGLLFAALAAAGVSGSMHVVVSQAPVQRATAAAPARAVAQPAPVVAAAAPATPDAPAPVIAFAQPRSTPFKFVNEQYFSQLRARMKWEPVRMGDRTLQTPDAVSRVLLTQAAAQKAGLDEVGLSWRDVYGIINAETSWIPRLGASKDGTPNLGIAQFEPATARALGLSDPNDPVQAVHAAALHLKEAAEWSARRLAGLKLSRAEYAMKLRDGLSIYYNLSSKGRAQWNGLNTAKLPIETQRHIANARRGRLQADELAQQLATVRAMTRAQGVMTASVIAPNS